MIPKLTLTPTSVAVGLLAVSLLVNLWQINRHVKVEKKLTTAEEAVKTGKRDLKAQVALTQSCSDSVATLKREADEAEKAHAEAIKAAQAKNQTHTAKAMKILSTPPSVPGDQCKSIVNLVGDWRKGRTP